MPKTLRMTLLSTAALTLIIGGALSTPISLGAPHQHGDSGKSDGATTQPATKPADTYVCPMHPEVTVAKPGKCPKCGMDLVKSEQAKKDKDQPKSDGHQPGHGHGAHGSH